MFFSKNRFSCEGTVEGNQRLFFHKIFFSMKICAKNFAAHPVSAKALNLSVVLPLGAFYQVPIVKRVYFLLSSPLKLFFFKRTFFRSDTF
jgi:hypothetical protein